MSVEGHFVYKGLAIAQNPNIYNYFKQLLTDINPERILEIGTFHGGLTLMLVDILKDINSKAIIRTYDIEEQKFLKPLVSKDRVEILTKNLFNNTYTYFKDEESKKEIESFISQKGTTIVLCDGGNKVTEFLSIAPLLKNLDIIMAHDYCINIDYFNSNIKDKIWNWMEIQYSDIEQCATENRLKFLFNNDMQNIAWLCMKKYN